MSNRVIIFDTTLRDGEQSPGATMNLQEKLRMARQLESLGVDVIEAGFPASSVGDFEAVHAIANAVTDVQVAALARCNKNDIDRAWQALNGARNPRIHVFLATSPIHMEYKLRKTPDQVVEMFNKDFAENDIWQHFDAVKNGRVYDLTYEYFGMSATFKYPQALEELQPILYPESDEDTQKAKEVSDNAQKRAKDSDATEKYNEQQSK